MDIDPGDIDVVEPQTTVGRDYQSVQNLGTESEIRETIAVMCPDTPPGQVDADHSSFEEWAAAVDALCTQVGCASVDLPWDDDIPF